MIPDQIKLSPDLADQTERRRFPSKYHYLSLIHGEEVIFLCVLCIDNQKSQQMILDLIKLILMIKISLDQTERRHFASKYHYLSLIHGEEVIFLCLLCIDNQNSQQMILHQIKLIYMVEISLNLADQTERRSLASKYHHLCSLLSFKERKLCCLYLL